MPGKGRKSRLRTAVQEAPISHSNQPSLNDNTSEAQDTPAEPPITPVQHLPRWCGRRPGSPSADPLFYFRRSFTRDVPVQPPREPAQNEVGIEGASEAMEHANNQGIEGVSEATEHANNQEAAQVSRKRGPNRNFRLEKEIHRTKQKPKVAIPEDENRVVGDWSSNYATELGIILRQDAPVRVKSWKYIPKFEKRRLYRLVKDKFDLDTEDPKVKAVVKADMGRIYGNWRNKCHQHYKKMGGGTVGKEHPTREFEERPEDWRWICENIFEEPKWKGRSVTNSQNRGNLKYIHKLGSKSIAAKRYEKRDPQTNMRPGPIETFSIAYKDKNGCWSSSIAEEAHQQLMQKKNESMNEDGEERNEEEICADVFGKRCGYIVGRGRGPKPKMNGRKSVFEVESSSTEVQQTIQAQKEQIEAQRAEIEAQRLQLDAQTQQLQNQSSQLEAQQTKIDKQQDQLDSQQTQMELQKGKLDWLMKHVAQRMA